MTPPDRIWIGTTLITLGIATAAINVPILPSGALIGFGIGTLLYGVILLRRARRLCGIFQPTPPRRMKPYRCTEPSGHTGSHRAVVDGELVAEWHQLTRRTR